MTSDTTPASAGKGSGDRMGRKRVVIEGVEPEIDCGRFPIKRIAGERVEVGADAFTDGHDVLDCRLLFRHESEPEWSETPMGPQVNDRWRGAFTVEELGRYLYTLIAWVDPFKTWRRDLEKRVAAGQDVSIDLSIGARWIDEAADRAREAGRKSEARVLSGLSFDLGRAEGDPEGRLALALDAELAGLMDRHADRAHATWYGRELGVVVDRERARFGAWYEFFPRSCGPAGRHGTFRDAEERLRYAAGMNFDVVYLPPIHPIGHTKRKGRNNAVEAEPGEIGSPWAIGSEEGGHKSIHPDLGTPEDFRWFVARARELGLETALDVAFQCSPDHPYVREHPEWFKKRPDGSIQYAENPPKKYEDIYPFDFETEDWEALWAELKSVFDHWIGFGVRIFRVDNPHTKPFAFWEWLIGEIKREHPDVLFLSEAFTRPKIMYRLAKLGFSQSYTYFAWRNDKWELAEYFTELTRTRVREFFRPNVWPNTPDILTERLRTGGRPMYVERLILAATLSASYGIYGPAYELLEDRPLKEGSEEYWDSEKYQLREWDTARPDSLAELIALLNRIRRENPALHSNGSLVFHPTDNDQVLCYSKATEDRANVVLVAVSLDPRYPQSGWLALDLGALGLAPDEGFEVHDQLTGARYHWRGARNFVALEPHGTPAHIFRVRGARRS
jgi:starch synthase (maltosyl-transferring)